MSRSGKWFKKYVGSLPSAIKWLFGLSLVFVVAYDFALKDMPIAFSGQTELGQIFRGLCFVFVTAPTVYFITAHYPNIKNRDKTYELAVQEIDIMLWRVKYNLVGYLQELSGLTFASHYPSEREWSAFTAKHYSKVDWQALSTITTQLTDDIRRIIAISDQDIETYKRLFGLEKNVLFKLNRRTPMSRETFAEYEPHVKEFLDNCRTLEHYRNTVLRDYLSL